MASSWPADWPDELARVVAITPHPDDELFTAALLARAAGAGASVSLVCATGGGRGWLFGKRAPAAEVIATRAAELDAACAALGIESVTRLGFEDAALGDDADDAVTGAIDAARPDLVVSFGPDGGYGHRDHVALVALIAAALDRREPRPRWLQRVFPLGAFADTVESINRLAPELLAVAPDGSVRDAVDWIVNSAPTEDARRAAHDAHASQRWMLDDLGVLFADEEWYVEA